VSHPVAIAAGAGFALFGINKAKWASGTACVRQLEATSDGYICVEMEDNKAFIADLEYLQSLYGAQQSRTPVRYWINRFERYYGLPRGGLGDISLLNRLL
jgi:hypothetical protein